MYFLQIVYFQYQKIYYYDAIVVLVVRKWIYESGCKKVEFSYEFSYNGICLVGHLSNRTIYFFWNLSNRTIENFGQTYSTCNVK